MSDALTLPFRFKEVGERLLITNEVGDYKFSDQDFVHRFLHGDLSEGDRDIVDSLSLRLDENERWRLLSIARRLRRRYQAPARKIDYLILIPTLRCNLSCSYCQVSRAPVDQPGYDWTEQILEDFKQFISGLELDEVKIEFQGGEPTLRPDLLEEISSFVRDEASHAEFVVCSNMVDVDETRIKSYLRSPDVSISTSIDGSVETMSKNRTSNDEMSEKVFANFRSYLDQFGPSKISALPTITEVQLSDPAQVITKYLELGFQSIFLRPVNYMGFARKQHKESIDNYLRWFDFYEEAMSLILEANEEGYLEEYYTALVVRKIFAGDSVGFVDYRSPSRFGHNFLVIDYDGVVYPSDEARMLSRLNYVDLSIGSLRDGLDEAKLAEINLQAENQTNPDCIHCAYQPFCGIDIVDDLSRYSKLDVIKHDSWFCKRQMSIFDFVFDKIERRDMRWLRVFSKWVKGNNQPMGSMELFRD